MKGNQFMFNKDIGKGIGGISNECIKENHLTRFEFVAVIHIIIIFNIWQYSHTYKSDTNYFLHYT